MSSTVKRVSAAATLLCAMTLGASFCAKAESAAEFFSAAYNKPGYYPTPGRVARSAIPRQVVSYRKTYRPGTIVINTKERRLYFVQTGGSAIKYGIGVGRPGFQWAGIKSVSRKAEWPGWTPPAAMRRRRPDLPRHMKGGIDNPLGARAMYLGSSLYRIHGSNEPGTIGQAVSSGCIRMTNDDVIHLYNRVRVGARVVVIR
ncbi:MAG: L,D-transpeptidase [Beijerinckiaceae bacterium]|jgi:lipoprotein-anchoring transpeptidase ErfK/SrfK|nr:L,D-transpeptidase [Beijerinckiaceae bacterium]